MRPLGHKYYSLFVISRTIITIGRIDIDQINFYGSSRIKKLIIVAYRGNALGPRNLALATKEINIPLVHFSTDYVFDGRQSRPYHEFDRHNPLSVYGQSKLAGEEEVQKSNPRNFIIRTAWLYHIVGKNFPQTILRLANQEQVRVVNDQFGSPTYAPHLAQAVPRILETEAYVAATSASDCSDLRKA